MPVFDTHTYLEGYLLPGINQNITQLHNLLRARGIERALVMARRAMQVDPIAGNRILKAMIDPVPGVYGCLVAHLNRVNASVQVIRELLSNRKFLGVYLTATDPEHPLNPLIADEVLNACRRYQKPIFLRTPNADCVEAGLHLARTYAMHRFVFLGMGGNEWNAAVRAAHESVNIYLETSGAMDRMKLTAAIETIGPQRILFGSGCPDPDPAAAFGLILDAEISPADQRRILYDNAMRLFNLEAQEGA
ncbi:MAG: amidohydrolase [Chthonomonadaceae bacterium]|nr:amidohydrolase [Chthonomonadaceae bacterium]